MAAGNEVVTVVIVEDTTIEVISCERAGRTFFFWRLIKDEKITETNVSLYDNAAEALDRAMDKVLPDYGIHQIAEPSAADFDALNLLLIWMPEKGPLSTLYEVVQWHKRLSDGSAKLEAARLKAISTWDMMLNALAECLDVTDAQYREAHALKEIQEKQFELDAHVNDREINLLEGFIGNFLGSVR